MEPLQGRRYWGKERVRMANGRRFYTWGRGAEERDHSQWDTTDGGANPGLDHHHRMLGGGIQNKPCDTTYTTSVQNSNYSVQNSNHSVQNNTLRNYLMQYNTYSFFVKTKLKEKHLTYSDPEYESVHHL